MQNHGAKMGGRRRFPGFDRLEERTAPGATAISLPILIKPPIVIIPPIVFKPPLMVCSLEGRTAAGKGVVGMKEPSVPVAQTANSQASSVKGQMHYSVSTSHMSSVS